MTNSQQFIPIESVNKNFIFQKDGSVGLLLSVSAVNFALLFETEQISIINSFAGLLNSLSFPIQIIILSKVLDVSSYLHVIDNALAKQTNPLLQKMTLSYRGFVGKSIKDNNVLDKQFYICIKATPLEIGLLPTNQEEKIHKVTTLLFPRMDHLIRQLGRLGVKAKQLSSDEIIKLFYDIYNPPETVPKIESEPGLPQQKLRPIKTGLNQIPTQSAQPIQPTTPNQPSSQPSSPIQNQTPSQIQLSPPFVVEELTDDN